MSEYDVLIIGGGAAGLSAAMVLARAQRSVLVVDARHPRNAAASHMHGYLSRDGMAPADLLDVGRLEVRGYGGAIAEGTVAQVTRCESGTFEVVLASGLRMTSRRLLVATGLNDQLPAVEGLAERWARDVLHCPYCHGHEVRGQKLGVLGGNAGSVRYAQIVRQWSDDVTYFTRPGELSDLDRHQLVARAIGIVEGDDARIVVENDRLVGVGLNDGRTVPRDALFVPPTFVPNNGVLVDLGCDVDEHGWVRADTTGQTSVPGVWAAGNVVNPRAQVITAAGEGSAAAIAINGDLVDEDIHLAVEQLADRKYC